MKVVDTIFYIEKSKFDETVRIFMCNMYKEDFTLRLKIDDG